MKLFAIAVVLFCALCAASASLEPSSVSPILPWRLDVPQSQLDDLRHRLESAILPTELEDVGDWSWGPPVSFLSTMRSYWLETYDWRDREKKFNEALVNQYMTMIDGLKTHFVHVRSRNESAVPLLFSHGWPGSVLECTKIIPLLTDHFHVICPSIPGYFFSEPPHKQGYDAQRVAEVFSGLMKQLGYKYYLAQGGDWGSEISRWLGIIDPNCIAIHINMVTAQFPLTHNSAWGILASIKTVIQVLFPTWFFDETEITYLDWMQTYAFKQSAYMHYQMTMPQSLAYAFSDSPLGLAAYLWEKYNNWADLKNGSLMETFTKDELIDFVMVYWVSNSISSSMRLYRETVPKMITEAQPYQHKPTAVAAFRDLVMPKAWVIYYFNIVRWTYQPYGGHFAALEAPELLAKDIIEFSYALGSSFENGFIPPKEKDEM